MNETVEQEIQRKGLTAPRITPEQIEKTIAKEFYFTADQGVLGVQSISRELAPIPEPLSLLTICVLVLQNGFTVLGESACASPENFDAPVGRRVARINAVAKIWALEGYVLKNFLTYRSSIGV